MADEKFLKIKGTVLEDDTEEPITDYLVKVVEDRLDSNSTEFDKSKFQVWAPANRRSKVYFIKEGYIMKHIYVDASAIPSIAYKKKQQIDVVIHMTKNGLGKYDYTKPIMVAEYHAKDNGFSVEKTLGESAVKKIDKNYSPPFPAPVDTYFGVKPTANNLGLTEKFNKSKASTGSLSKAVQGVLFADMNYCLFNERTNEANIYLKDLKSANNSIWGNIKEFDSPEYGRIVMRTVNREQSIDTLFALGVYVETSRLVFENFTSDSKVLVHLKKLKKVLLLYKGQNLEHDAKAFLDQLNDLVPKISELEDEYTTALRNKMNFEMAEDAVFIEIKTMNQEIYEKLIN